MARNKYGVVVNRNGVMMMTRNHVILLLALWSLPDQTTPSRAAWVRACAPILAALAWHQAPGNLIKSVHHFPGPLVDISYTSKGYECQLTDLGKELVDKIISGEVELLEKDCGVWPLKSQRFEFPQSLKISA